jgi:copper chaperone CopZ
MSRILVAFAVSLALPAAAFACADGKCKEGCHLPAATAESLPSDGNPHVTLAVTGMKCGACADKVKASLTAVPGVAVAVVDATTGKAQVSYDAKKTSPDKLAAAATAIGFTAKVEG